MKSQRIIAFILTIIMMLSTLSSCQAEQTANENATTTDSSQDRVQETMPVEQFAYDTVLKAIRVVVDGIVHNFDVYVADDVWYISAKDAGNAFGDTFTEEYIDMDAYAQSADIRYIQDEVLTAAYFSTWEPYAEKVSVAGFETYADELNLPLDKLGQESVSGTEMAELLDCFVAHEAPDQMDGWKEISEKLRNSSEPLYRCDALAALFLAAWKVGGSYMEYDMENHSMQMRDAAFDKESEKRNWNLFSGMPIPDEYDVGFGAKDHYGSGSCVFNLGTVSPVDAANPFSYDGTSFRHDEKATYLEAVVAILRVYSTNGATVISVDDPAAVVLSGIFTEDLLNKAGEPATVTAKNHPKWTGFALNGEMDFNLSEVPAQVALCGNWGFNSARLNLDYQQLFDIDVTEVDLSKLNVLDQIVAQAVKYNMHLNIIMTSLPGRWAGTTDNFDNKGDFDLFLNEEKQAQALRILEILSERYKDISNDYLSFTPVFEPMNRNRSTGATPPEYTFEDYDVVLGEFIDAIYEISPERLIILEPVDSLENEAKLVYTAFSKEDNVMFSYNFCETPFVYANMTVESGRNIDDENRSFYLLNYPTYYYDLSNFIYDAEEKELCDMIMGSGNYEEDGTLLIDGCLPAGTTLELYLRQSFGGELQIIADGEMLYKENLGHNVFNVGETLSGYINYAVSDKKITVTLAEDTDLLEIAVPGGAVTWTAMDIWLPDEYMQERWYYATPYDFHQGLESVEGLVLKKEARIMIWPYDLWEKNYKENHLTIHEDLTYSTPVVRTYASKESVEASASAMSALQQGGMVRYERANFNGTSWESMVAYYKDMFVALNDNNLGWWSNDWYVMTNSMANQIAGVPESSYRQYSTFNVELLKLMQQYQNNERP